MKKTVLALLAVVSGLLAQRTWAQNTGTTGADILKIPIGVRPAALGGTYSAFGDDVYVIGYNPAGLARISKYSLGIDHIEGFAGVEIESLSFALPTKDYGNLGAQVIFRHMPDINNTLATDPIVTADDLVVTFADASNSVKWPSAAPLRPLSQPWAISRHSHRRSTWGLRSSFGKLIS